MRRKKGASFGKARSYRMIATALHEAGHAVIAYHYQRRFRRVSIIPDVDSLGAVLYERFARSFKPDIGLTAVQQRSLEVFVMCSLAGPEAERRFRGRANHVGAKGDYASALDMASYACGSAEETRAYVNWLRVKTVNAVGHLWPIVEALAQELLAVGELDYRQASKIIREAYQRRSLLQTVDR